MPMTSHRVPARAALDHRGPSSGLHSPEPTSPEDLVDAFREFNRLSQDLSGAYTALTQRVHDLSGELESVSAKRMQELAERDQLATRLEVLLQALPAGVVVVDRSGCVTAANPAAQSLLGVSVIGESWHQVVATVVAPQGADGHEVRLRSGRLVSVATRCIEGADGQLILLTDQTETRKLQEALARNERLTTLGRMMAALAHQLRTPLSAATLYADHLRRQDLETTRRTQFANKLFERLQHMEQQIREMSVFVTGQVALPDLETGAELLAAFRSAAEPLLSAADVRVQWVAHLEDVELRCNREVLLGAWLNLLNNAVQALGHTREIHVSVASWGAHGVALRIDDSGSGLRGREREVTREFFTTKAAGTGLGLPVVQAVARAHGGELFLGDSPLQGTRAEIRLPSGRAPAQKPQERFR